jgi:hypothetical protein
MENIKNYVAKIVKSIISKFKELNGASFIGINQYLSSTTGELCNYVIVANFSYAKAILKDLQTLKNISTSDIQKCIANVNANYNNVLSIDLIKQAIDKLIQGFEKNQNKETQSAQSKSQQEAYVNICDSIRLHIESRKLFIYGLVVSKEILQKGEYKSVNSSDLTLAQNAVKKFFNLSTAKFRQFNIDPEQLTEVALSGQRYEF